MNTIAMSFVAGISFGTGLLLSVMIYMMFRKSDRSKVDAYNQETVELMRERNAISARIAKALEGDFVVRKDDLK